ncbi:MAG: hypothetical protein EPN21_09065 [Methylococcaceae bacterium]|nr:MAG: hypothetical protein EPN21_09065 [Methylococcaceae bacterium]
MQSLSLDDFRDLAGWSTVSSGQAKLTITPDQGPDGRAAMRLDFDFCGSGGFVVVRKPFDLSLPETYAFALQIRGEAPRNKFEFKLVDAGGHNVWRYQEEAFDFTPEWRTLKIRNSRIDFAWGPAGGGAMARVGAIEMVIAAGPGGTGSVWIADLEFVDLTYRATPQVQASSFLPGCEPCCVLDESAASYWQCAPDDAQPWLLLDFLEEREFGGLVLHWAGSGAEAFQVFTSNDAEQWYCVFDANLAEGGQSPLYLPQCAARYLRIDTAGGIAHIAVKPYDFSRSLHAFFHHLAQDAPRGHYPKYWCGEQTLWTPVGVPNGNTRAILNEEGMLEVDEGRFSLEPLVYLDDGPLLTWADAQPVQLLEQGYLPIPAARWNLGELALTITACADDASGKAVLYARYRCENVGNRPLPLKLFVAIRPFQVTPPWQAYKNLGGASPIHRLVYRDGAVWVNDERAVLSLDTVNRFGCAAFEQGDILQYLKKGAPLAQLGIDDEFGYASAAFAYEFTLAPGAVRDVYLAVPFGTTSAAEVQRLKSFPGAKAFGNAQRAWQNQLAGVDIRLPGDAQAGFEAFKTAAAHILINRDGPAIQPGPRRYTRSWIRDGALMAAALLRLGCDAAARDFIRWYAPYLNDEGCVPCCVDSDGADWLAEYDSQGEFVFVVMEYFRFSGDLAFLRELWPSVCKALDYLESLRNRRLTTAYQQPDKSACWGLLPESVSHEGYLAHPVHAYWDDFWALRGLNDAVEMAEALQDNARLQQWTALRDDFRRTLAVSVTTTMQQRGIDFLPGSVEWADFDPTASAIAVSLLYDELPWLLPPIAVERTFAKYLDNFRRRCRDEIAWTNYTPYEIRVVGALVRLGQRSAALELLASLLADRRPPAWNQWPEIAWHDPKTPGHVGDLPHTWIAAEYMLSFRSLFVFEQEAEHALVIAAGLDGRWLADGFEIRVRNLPTYYGLLSYALRQESDDSLSLHVSGDFVSTPTRIVIKPPLPRALRRVEVDGSPLREFGTDSVSLNVAGAPIEVLMVY